MKQHISKEALIQRIEYADGMEIDEIINAIQRRYNRLYPDWEVVMLSLPAEVRVPGGSRGSCLSIFPETLYGEMSGLFRKRDCFMAGSMVFFNQK